MSAVPAKKQAPVLMPDRFGEAEFKTKYFVADAEVGVTPEQVMDPNYWAHVAAGIDPFDKIEVRAEDGSWVAHLVAVSCERHYTKVILDRLIKIEENVERDAPSSKYKVEFKGTHHKFVVVRLADGQVLQSGFKTRLEAETWMRNHEKGMER